MLGIQLQVLKIISLCKGINKEEIAAILGVRPQYIAEICQFLVRDGYLMNSIRTGGYALKIEAKNELKDLARNSRVVYEGEISQRLSISAELTSEICQSLAHENFLVKTAKSGYVLKEDLNLVLKTIRDNKELTGEEIAQHLNISSRYTALLCQYWIKNFSVLKNQSGKYIQASKDVFHLLKIIDKYGHLNKKAIIHKMQIGPGYAEILCNSLVKEGYLEGSPEEEYFLPEARTNRYGNEQETRV